MENEEQVVAPEGDQAPETENTQEESVADESNSDLKANLDKEKEARRELTARAKKAEANNKVLEAKLNALKSNKSPLDVEDYIDISASLEGLDSREKSYLAEQHKLTGRPLKEIRNDEDFLLWQSAYQIKVEKDRALKPSNAQPESDRPRNLVETLAEIDRTYDPRTAAAKKAEILERAGLHTTPRPKTDRSNIGPR